MENINISLTKVASTVVFVDSSLDGLETFHEHLGQDAHMYLLSHEQNMLSQISHVMSKLTDIKALHLFTHGHSGELLLGENGVSLETLPLYGKELVTISNAMSADGELYMYGCEVAAGERGAAFVKMLGDITGLKVAAATHKVGHEELGGSWKLDAKSTVMENDLHVSEWRGVLAAPDLITGLGGDAGFGESSFARNDDGYTAAIDITPVFGAQGLKFGSTYYTETYINNNGMITFGQGFGGYTPSGISDGLAKSGGGFLPLISLFWTDIDTEGGLVAASAGGTSTGTNLVHYDIDTVGKKITFTWDDVGLYEAGTTPALAGQIILYDAGSGNMNIEFRYEYAGLYDGYEAAAGWNVGVGGGAGTAGVDYYQIAAPGDLSWLDTTAGNTGVDGVYRWYLRDGAVSDSAGAISYGVNTFVESSSNDGSIVTSITVTLVGDTFTGNDGDDFVGSKVIITNVPIGLTAVMTRTSDTTATLTLTGTATDHTNAQDIANLTVSFDDSAFTGNNASIINNATSKTFQVDFIEASNTAPTGLGNVTLTAVDEDMTAPAGAAISSLTDLSFADTDGGDTLSGVAVVANTANASTEGKWQYSTNAGTNWSDIGTVSATEALALSSATLVRFLPVANYNGTPPALSVHALDGSANYFSATSGSESRVTLDASNNGGASAIATATNTISTTINPVNDAPPVITSNGGESTAAINVVENATAVTTITTTDIDGSDTVTYSISGGADSAKFSINASTGVLTFTSAPDYESPTDADTNNTYVVEVSADDNNGGADTQTITVTVTDVNESTGSTYTPPPPPPTNTIINDTNLTGTKTTSVIETVGTNTVITQSATGTRTYTDASGSTVTQSNVTVEAIKVTATTNTSTGNTTAVPLYWGESTKTEWATTASLSSGVTLSSEGNRAPTATQTTATALDNLMYYIQTTVQSTDTSKTTMLGGGSSFLSALSNIGNLVVNKVTLSAPTTGSSTTPAIISLDGTANGITTNGVTDIPKEALVIDASTLPTNSTILLNNIEFGVIVGENLTIRGGEGQNKVFAGEGSQDIMCGADDDELHAGAGDDTVGSAGGDDLIFGEAGDDTVFGGEGNDLLHGGSGVDKATYTLNMSDYLITRDEGKTYVSLVSNPNEKDTLINTETIEFADATYTVENRSELTKIATLYTQILGRQAEIDGFQYWANDNVDIGQIALGFITSQEYKTKSGVDFDTLDISAKIETFYEALLGRTSDSDGKSHWINLAQSGAMSIDQIANSFVDSVEMQGIYLNKDGWDFIV